MFNIYTVEKHLDETMRKATSNLHETDENAILKKKLKTEIMSTKYRSRVANFVTEMAAKPLVKLDDYNENWHRKYSKKSAEVKPRNNSMMTT